MFTANYLECLVKVLNFECVISTAIYFGLSRQEALKLFVKRCYFEEKVRFFKISETSNSAFPFVT